LLPPHPAMIRTSAAVSPSDMTFKPDRTCERIGRDPNRGSRGIAKCGPKSA
jgi:hypothetical protein